MSGDVIDFAEAMRRQAAIDNAPLETQSEQPNEAEQPALQNRKRPLEAVNLSLCSGEHYLENFPPSFDWLLKDSLRNACIGLVVAPPGCGKGQFCIQLVTALGAGLPCLGTWTPTQRVKAFYLSAEDDALILHRRLFHVLKSLPYEAQELAASNVYAIPVSGDVSLFDPNTGTTTQNFADLKKLIATHRPQALIVDTLVRFLPINENDNPIMSKALGFIEELCLEFDCNILFVHHTAKAAGALATDTKELAAGLEQTALRGFTAATGAARWQLNMMSLSKELAAKAIGPEAASRPDGCFVALRVSKKNCGTPESTIYAERGAQGLLYRVEPSQQEKKAQCVEDDAAQLVAEVRNRLADGREPLAASKAGKLAFSWGQNRNDIATQRAIDQGLLVRQSKAKGKGEVLCLAEGEVWESPESATIESPTLENPESPKGVGLYE